MTDSFDFSNKVIELIDDLKSVCANYGLGNDGNEYRIITQIFLYKFLHDKFIDEIKGIKSELRKSQNWEQYLANLSADEYELLTMKLGEGIAVFQSKQLISSLFSKQNEANFADIFDSALREIALLNADIFSVVTGGGEKIALFENLSRYVSDNRDDFCRAIINKLVGFSFENIFNEGFDFFATIFEYLIKDYNSDSGGKYAEYFTPHSVSGIMANCLVPDSLEGEISDVTCYDPSAGSGTLLMNLAHKIGEDKCTIFSQDIAQKSSNLLRLNLILNGLVHSIHNIIQGNSLVAPFHKDRNGALKKFDFIVSNPPFKLDFSEFRSDLEIEENNDRFFAGIPKIPPKEKESMAIYLPFLQHVIYSLKPTGKAAVVVPTGFLTVKNKIEKKIRQKLVNEKMLAGVINMPTNIFAKTGTNVSILFIDKTNQDEVILIDASSLGEKVKQGNNQKTVLRSTDIEKILTSYTSKKKIDGFSIAVTYEDLKTKDYSFNPAIYFDIKIDYEDISPEEFSKRINESLAKLDDFANESEILKNQIANNLLNLDYEV
ncbi:class I SAM-dependent DNA methyltransferase [uncultured Prochlorococcus sp.]|uniref:HsdM family class I SAM-dependent methyltransferase n=1 Tax=uncultured Prochlorococcus sp. TaxID=159733 RepID=UPI00258D5C63|nr:class I SAM-dependent DNA methyltransferase [uncultured Prochlorococcus sp.]